VKKLLHCQDPFDRPIKLVKLLSRHNLPSVTCCGAAPKSEKQITDLFKRKSDLPGLVYHSQPIHDIFAVSALPALSHRRRQDSQPFVITNCRRTQANPSPNFRNR